jgi:hypothetical protein
MFDSTKKDLKEILKDVHQAKIQLPDFQRDYVWADEDIKSLIASIAKGFPVGALLTLETGGPVNFKPRLLEGVPENTLKPSELLLDGQQRITSLYKALFSDKPVNIQGHEILRYYYLDIKSAVEGYSIDDSILGIPSDRVIKANFGREIILDLNQSENEYKNNLFPLNKIYKYFEWFMGWKNYSTNVGCDNEVLEKSFYDDILKTIESYEMPIIKLDKNNSREAICLVFEKVNVGGKRLDAYELVTAIYASDEFDLREDWSGNKKLRRHGRLARMIGFDHKRDVLTKVANTEFLQACTLLHTRELRLAKENQGFTGKELPQVSCKREALLELPLSSYKKFADSIESGFVESAKFLNSLSIISHKDISYPPLLVALASIYAICGQRSLNATASQKLEQWFWSISLGELYSSSTETRIAKDVPELVNWIGGEAGPPASLGEAVFQLDRLKTLRSRNSAAYKAMHTLLMKAGSRDFVKNQTAGLMTFFDDQIDIHHIFPISWCEKNGIPRGIYNSIINKTALSKDTNIFIGGSTPSLYLSRIESKHGISKSTLDSILKSHLIDPDKLRSDNFYGFFEDRKIKLAELISNAMKKPVFEGSGSNESIIGISDDGDEDD